jgi:hypothetical protein
VSVATVPTLHPHDLWLIRLSLQAWRNALERSYQEPERVNRLLAAAREAEDVFAALTAQAEGGTSSPALRARVLKMAEIAVRWRADLPDSPPLAAVLGQTLARLEGRA